MEDQFLHDMRRDPDPAFEADLRRRLQTRTGAPTAPASAWRPVAWAAAAIAVVAGLFAFPSVRASAQSFLDIFRVRTFTPVAVDPERFKVLDSERIDLEHMLSKNIEIVQDAGPGRDAADAAEAASLAGYAVRQPAYLPAGFAPAGVHVSGEGLVRMTADTAVLAEVLRLLDLDDVRIPANLNGAQVQVHMPPMVQMRYERDARVLRFLQSPSPDVRLPPAMDLEDLGEIALRIAGLSGVEAHRLAQSIDWHTTLLLPVPTTANGFRKVTVNGVEGLLVEAREGRSAVMWADGERVYAVTGNAFPAELLEMANSVR